MIADYTDLIAGVLMGAIWTSVLYAIYIARFLP